MFYGKYKILLILAFLFMLGLTAVVFISFTEAFSIGNAEPYAVAHFMEKALDAGMDGSGIGLIAIPKTILLLIPSVVYRFTEETILLLVAAGTSFYRHPIRLVLLLIILIAVAIFLYLVFIFIAGILDIRKAEKKEAKEEADYITKCQCVTDLPYEGWTFTGYAHNGIPYKGTAVNPNGYKVSFINSIVNGEPLEIPDLDGRVRIEYDFGYYYGKVWYSSYRHFWYPDGEGTLYLNNGRTIKGVWVEGELDEGEILVPETTLYFDLSSEFGIDGRYKYEESLKDTYYGAFHPIGICLKKVGTLVNKKTDASVQEVFYDIIYRGQLHHLTPSGVGTLLYKRHVDWIFSDKKMIYNSAYEDSRFEDAEWKDGKMILTHSRVMNFSAPGYQGKGEMTLTGNIPMPTDPDKIPGLCDIHKNVNRTPIVIE